MRIRNTSDFKRKVLLVPKHTDKNYDYSEVDYVDSQTPVKIRCKEHGEFWPTPNNHLKGTGCPTCGNLQISNKRRGTFEEFKNLGEIKHRSFFDYSEVIYINSQTKVKIICPNHGPFWQRPAKHLFGNGCPKCKISRGEQAIAEFLDKHKISYKSQFRFNDCRNRYPFPFDFAILNKGKLVGLIEYHGEQHYKPMRYRTGEQKFLATKHTDAIKQSYCKLNNIPLLIIPYTKFKTIETEVKNFLASIPTVRYTNES